MKTSFSAGRLTFRNQGQFFNAYWCPDGHSMKGKILLGSIKMTFIADDKQTFDDFVELFKNNLSRAVVKHFGEESGAWAEWSTTPPIIPKDSA